VTWFLVRCFSVKHSRWHFEADVRNSRDADLVS
jgi:hypothetical protein